LSVPNPRVLAPLEGLSRALSLINKPLLQGWRIGNQKGSPRWMLTIWLAELEPTTNCYKDYSNIKSCTLIKQNETCKCVYRIQICIKLDGLPWLASPWSSSSWYSNTSPSSVHSSFDSIVGKITHK
jgi:hypothetical protein